MYDWIVFDWNLLLAGVFIYGYLTYRANLPDPKRKKFPGPIHLPGIGCLLQASTVKISTMGMPYYLRLHGMIKKFGTNGTAEGTGGFQNFLITENFEVAKEILASPDVCARFPSHPRFKEHTYDKSTGLIFNSGESWKEMRKFAIKTLKEFGFGELKASEVFLQEELSDFLEFMDKDRLKNPKNEVFMHEYFKIPTFNILWRVMSGDRFKYDDPEILNIIRCVDQAAKIEVGMDLEWAYPIVRFIPGMSSSRAQGQTITDCQNFFKRVLHQKRALGLYKEYQTTYMDCFLKKIDDEKGNPNTWYTDENFIICCLDLLYGGLDTTASAIEFAIMFMTKYPEIQKKCQDELDRVVGRNRVANVFDRGNLPYCSATLLEVLRHADIIPVLCRAVWCDTTISGNFIPKDTAVGILCPIIHKDPKLFNDPTNFHPENFHDENMNVINEDKLLVFGGGKRLCLGYTMGKVMLTTFFSRILQKYNLEQSPGRPDISIIPDYAIANTAKPFYCVIKLRDEE